MSNESELEASASELEASASELEDMNDRLEQMEIALGRSLRGIVMMFQQVEIIINPLKEPEERAKALQTLNYMLDVMKT